MKKEDFERLKAVCEEEGFELLNETVEDNEKFFVVKKKKDEWYGMEFVENLDQHLTGGKKYFKVNWIDNETNLIHVDCGYFTKIGCKPSPESAYVEQLKKECFKRFGEIKDGDRFDSADGYRVGIEFNGYANDIQYSKEIDTLFIGGLRLYQQGKWATRVKEKVTGVYVRHHILWPNEDGANLGYSFKGFDKDGALPIDKLEDAGKFLAYQLEKYLNGEIK